MLRHGLQLFLVVNAEGGDYFCGIVIFVTRIANCFYFGNIRVTVTIGIQRFDRFQGSLTAAVGGVVLTVAVKGCRDVAVGCGVAIFIVAPLAGAVGNGPFGTPTVA